MRHKIKFIALSLACEFLIAGGLAEAESPAKTFQAGVKIAQSAQIVKAKEIEFGDIESGDSDGTVRVTTTKQRFVIGGVQAEDDFHPARFKIRGEPNTTYNIQIPDQTVSNEEGTGILSVTDFEIFSKTAGAVTTTGQFNNFGKDMIKVGGTLQVPAGSPEGEYEGDLVIHINY